MNIPQSGSIRKGCTSVTKIGVILVAIPLVVLSVLILAGWFLVVSDPVKESDAIVLLSGGDHVRLNEALRLYRERKAVYFVLTETGESVSMSDKSATRFMRLELIEKGVASDSILITRGVSTSTSDEARRVKEIMGIYDLQSCIVVTDPYHTFRTRLIFRNVFRTSGMTIRVHPARGHWYHATTWFFSYQGWRMTVQEYIKLFAYLIGLKRG